jgi:hypothetical protein
VDEVDLPDGQVFHEITHITLPPGTFFVTAAMETSPVNITDEFLFVACTLSGIQPHSIENSNREGPSQMPLQGISMGGTVSVSCANNPGGGGFTPSRVRHVSLVAIQVGTLHQ